MRKFLINGCLLLFGSLMGLLAAEGLLFLIGYQPYYSDFVAQQTLIDRYTELEDFCRIETIEEGIEKGILAGSLGSLRYDKTIGYTYDKGLYGFKDTKIFHDDFSHYKRVLMLGDSFTAGNSAEPDHGFVDLLGQYYKEKDVVFFNTGVGGYGQNNQLAILKKYFNVLKPHVVVLGFYTGNDFMDNLTPLDRFTAFPRNWVGNYEVILTGNTYEVRKRTSGEIMDIYQNNIGCTPSEAPQNTLKIIARDQVFYQTRLGTQILFLVSRIKSGLFTSLDMTKKTEGYTTYDITKKYLKDIKEFSERKNIKFYVLVIPDYHASRQTLLKSENHKKAIKIFHELNLEYLDPINELNLQDYVGTNTASRNDHWNNSGHLKMFKKVIAQFDETFEYKN